MSRPKAKHSAAVARFCAYPADKAILPYRLCRNCFAQGHSSNECEQPLNCAYCREDRFTLNCGKDSAAWMCMKCGEQGHAGFQCNEPFTLRGPRDDEQDGRKCFNCKKPGHVKEDCTAIICANCKEQGHTLAECPKMICKTCGEPGHMSRQYEKRECTICHEMGHHRSQCIARLCKQCGQVGHTLKDCQERQAVSGTCRGPHPTSQCPIGREKADQADKNPRAARPVISAARDYKRVFARQDDETEESKWAAELLQNLRPAQHWSQQRKPE